MATILMKPEFSTQARHGYQYAHVSTCKPFGGDCLADGCVHWFPLPSPEGVQEAACGIARNHEPIHRREAQRKSVLYAHLATVDYIHPTTRRMYAEKAKAWALAALNAPVRAPNETPAERQSRVHKALRGPIVAAMR